MIVVDNVTKVIGKTEVLKNISYHFESGQIYGLAGRNGAGAGDAAHIAVVQPPSGTTHQGQGNDAQNARQLTVLFLHNSLPLKILDQPISAASALSIWACSASACALLVIAPTMGSPTMRPLRLTT